jgi:predicted TIM-barrel fold metal-dependent hydrolase
MASDYGIVDVWTQFISPNEPGANPAGENVFRNYGMLDMYYNGTNVDQMVAAMDEAGIEIAMMAGNNESVAKAVKKHPGRIVGQYHANPTEIMKAVRGLERYVKEFDFKCLRIEPFMWKKAPTDRCYYPLYAKCVELDVAFQTQVGHTGPLYPSETGRPLYIDEVALDFPELRIVCGHIGWPWTEEMIAVAWKHQNVFIDTSAHLPKHFPERFVYWMQRQLQDKVMYASDYPLVPFERILSQIDEHLKLTPQVKKKYLCDNARRAFKL